MRKPQPSTVKLMSVAAVCILALNAVPQIQRAFNAPDASAYADGQVSLALPDKIPISRDIARYMVGASPPASSAKINVDKIPDILPLGSEVEAVGYRFGDDSYSVALDGNRSMRVPSNILNDLSCQVNVDGKVNYLIPVDVQYNRSDSRDLKFWGSQASIDAMAPEKIDACLNNLMQRLAVSVHLQDAYKER
ncbi:hypothetical protein [Neptuniibacter sp. QD37_11]|uniref:hypothetical protein n=1 Tax=Neptuniibacter sp. QD37_11 TaxID=3398209 RepID=UPI0039F615A6